MMCSHNKGCIIVEKGQVINEAPFTSGVGNLKAMAYANHVDAYFLVINHKVYKKTISGLHQDLWIGGFTFGYNHHTPFEYSVKNRRIFTMIGTKTIAVINPEKKEVEFQLPLSFADYIMDYKFFGENHEFIAFVTWNRYIAVFKYDAEKKEGSIITHLHYPAYPGKPGDHGMHLSVDPKRHVFMVTNTYTSNHHGLHSRVTTFELWNNRFTLKHSLNEFGLPRIEALNFVKYYKNHVIFIGVDQAKGGNTHLFRYNLHTGVAIEDTAKRVSHLEDYTHYLDRYGDWFYYTGRHGGLNRVQVYESEGL